MPKRHTTSATIIPVHEAVGKVLAHDITEIRPGQFKGPAFKKGDVIREEDIPHLRRLGKEHLYVLHMGPEEVHEDDAAMLLAKALAGPGVCHDNRPSEGKIALKAAHRGLLKVNIKALTALNRVPDICCSSRHTHVLVEEGDLLAATRVIPLVVRKRHLDAAIRISERVGGIFTVKALSQPITGLVITGNEVYNGLIEDKFAPILRRKLQAFGCRLVEVTFSPDDKTRLIKKIGDFIQKGMELILVAGGMSVDPDDISRLAIRQAGAKDMVYGTPVLPGAMFLSGRIGQVPILGIPACVLYYQATILDLVLPRVLAGETITRKDMAAMAHGGLCLQCRECHYPICPFGK